jgi:hypothetical protein
MSFMCGEQWLETGNPFLDENYFEKQDRIKSALKNIMSTIHKTDNTVLSAETHICSAITDLLPLLNEFIVDEDDADIVLYAIGMFLGNKIKYDF